MTRAFREVVQVTRDWADEAAEKLVKAAPSGDPRLVDGFLVTIGASYVGLLIAAHVDAIRLTLASALRAAAERGREEERASCLADCDAEREWWQNTGRVQGLEARRAVAVVVAVERRIRARVKATP